MSFGVLVFGSMYRTECSVDVEHGVDRHGLEDGDTKKEKQHRPKPNRTTKDTRAEMLPTDLFEPPHVNEDKSLVYGQSTKPSRDSEQNIQDEQTFELQGDTGEEKTNCLHYHPNQLYLEFCHTFGIQKHT